MARGDLEAAVTTYRRVERQGPEYLPEILPALLEGYRRLGERDDMVSVLKQLYRSHPNSAGMLALADIIENDEGNAAAAAFVAYLSSLTNISFTAVHTRIAQSAGARLL